ncbi:MAG: PAS domain S-box protein [Leptolyngbya sp. Prado105]|jgi:PAS domain S-box-containing protein|nr:PAS domain S-box protein [Leptolyngbya sp. Prado105]
MSFTLQDRQQLLQRIADTIPGILYLFDLEGHRNLYINRSVGELLGYPAAEVIAMGESFTQKIMHPEDFTRLLEHIEKLQAIQTDESLSFEYRMRHRDGNWRWFWSQDTVFQRTEAGVPRLVLGTAIDISDRKQSEADLQEAAEIDAFCIALNDALCPLTDVDEIQAAAARVLGESLRASRVAYAEVLPNLEQVIVHQSYTHGVSELSGIFDAEAYGRDLIQDYSLGRQLIIQNIQQSSRYSDDAKARFAAIEIASIFDVPLIKDGQLVALLIVHQSTPREWTRSDARRIKETAERTWAAVERARAEAALRRSQAKYRLLFDSMDQGFCLCEMLFDPQGNPLDYRFLEVNSVFESMTGLRGAAGKTALALVPELEHYWIEIYANVVRTGEPVRFENQSVSMNRWFDVNAFALEQSNQFAILFTNITERKRSERERDRFLAVGSDLQVITSTNGYFRWVSPAFEQALGWTSGEMTTRPWREFVYLDDTEATLAEVEKLFSGEATLSFENRFRCKDGSYRWLLWKAQPYLEEQVLYGAAVDITDRKLTEAALQQSEERSRNILESITDGFFALNQDWQFTYINKAAERLLDRSNLELAGKSLWTEYAALKGTEFERIYRAAMSDRVVGSTTAFYAEHQRWYEVRAYPALSGITVYFRNITERLRSEAALRESEERYRSLFESIDEGFCVIEVLFENGIANDYRFLEINPAFEQQTGLIQATGKTIRELVPDIEPFWFDIYANVLKTGEPMRFQDHSAVMNRWFDIYAFRLDPAENCKVAILFQDVTERRRIEIDREQLLIREQAAREAADRANRIKDEFLAVLSHELRTPLNPILGWIRLLQTGRLDPDRQRDALTTIERNAKLQSQLIEDLLDISRIIQGKLALNPTIVDLTSIIAAAVETVRLAAEAKQIRLKLDLNPTTPVSGDPARLQQVVWNLLTNAVKFTPNGGQVTIALNAVDRLAEIRVIDTGKGIQPDFLLQIFESFQQEDGSTTRKFGGLGLGLAIVRRIVEMHGGIVYAESQGIDQGATFIVQLPMNLQAKPDEPEPISPHSTRENELSHLTILLVDDDLDTRELQAFILEQSGATVILAESGQEALQMLDRTLPDLIVSDLGMPEMNGYMLMQQIRARPSDQGGAIPAIAVSAYAGDANQQQAFDVGFQKHLAKPVEPEELIRTVAALARGCSEV